MIETGGTYHNSAVEPIVWTNPKIYGGLVCRACGVTNLVGSYIRLGRCAECVSNCINTQYKLCSLCRIQIRHPVGNATMCAGCRKTSAIEARQIESARYITERDVKLTINSGIEIKKIWMCRECRSVKLVGKYVEIGMCAPCTKNALRAPKNVMSLVQPHVVSHVAPGACADTRSGSDDDTCDNACDETGDDSELPLKEPLEEFISDEIMDAFLHDIVDNIISIKNI